MPSRSLSGLARRVPLRPFAPPFMPDLRPSRPPFGRSSRARRHQHPCTCRTPCKASPLPSHPLLPSGLSANPPSSAFPVRQPRLDHPHHLITAVVVVVLMYVRVGTFDYVVNAFPFPTRLEAHGDRGYRSVAHYFLSNAQNSVLYIQTFVKRMNK